MYDRFSLDYDRFVDWPGRLNFEIPFLLAQISKSVETQNLASLQTQLNTSLHPASPAPPRVLDAACGTGWHAIALAQRGYATAGADLSAGMIERARANAAAAGVEVRFAVASFGELDRTLGSDFDALLCLGNSLPHLLTPAALQAALVDFARCLAPGGVLIVQNRNFDQVMEKRQRWMEPQSHREGDAEWLFLRFYDFDPDGLITFNILSLQRQGDEPWTQQLHTTRLRPLLHAELTAALPAAGFTELQAYGSLGGEGFDHEKSGNLVIVARAFMPGAALRPYNK
jgi:glycine/sarcosine N-methyltransferase